jgi:hypothetical protein
MKNLEKIEKVKELFNEGIKLLKQIDISDKDEINDIVENFGSLKIDDGGIFSQLEYIKEDIIDEMKK